jgi:6-phosphogluconolactonase (cycloisomerase 2 family)
MMTFSRLLAVASLLVASTAAARTLYVGSGLGTITAYDFDESSAPLKQLFQTSDSSPSPSWQSIFGGYLYSVSETSGTTDGVIMAYKIESDKKLTKKGSAKSLAGPVSIAVAKEGKLLVSAA